MISSYQKQNYLEWCNRGDFLVDFLVHYQKPGLRLAKSVLIPLGLRAAVSAADAAMHKKFLGSGTTQYQIKKWKVLWK